MKRKIENYLKTKDKSEFNHLDRLFELYFIGNIKMLLSKYTKVKVYPAIHKTGNAIQLNYNFHNICVLMDFFEDKYSVAVYHAGINAEDLEKLVVECDYQEGFSLNKLINEVDKKIKSHPELKDTTLIEKKKKIYSLIAMISLCVPTLFWGGIGLYCILTESVLQFNEWWVMFLLIIPIILWFIFDVKAKRL